MKITEVKVFPVSEEKLKAFVSVVLDGCFMVNDIKVIRGKDGLFISMPSRKKKNGEFKDVAHPLNNETRLMIEERVLDEYEVALRERGEEPDVARRQLRVEEATAAAAGPLAASGAPAVPVEQAARPVATTPEGEATPAPGGGEAEQEKSLEEVQELHLRDSFWSVS